MTIELTCVCGRRLRVGAEHAGEQGRCPACGGLLRIPEGDVPASASPRGAANESVSDQLFGPPLVESHVPPAGQTAAGTKPGPEKGERLTAAGCALALVSVAVILAVAIPVVRWRDPATGHPLPRTVAIFAPVLIGAAVNGAGMLLLKLVDVRVWVKTDP